MTTYNGQEYVEEQINSILCQLGPNDELIVSDDGSSDLTLILVKDIIANDARVKLLSGPREGLIKNFENALLEAKGKYIFLADQDDVWHSNKVEKFMECFNVYKSELVLSDAYITDSNLNVVENSFFKCNKSQKGFTKNLIKNSYLGCCLAFKRELLADVLPFPSCIPMHDWWIGIVSEYKNRNIVFLNESLLYYRRHGSNVSPTGERSPYSLIKKISFRLQILNSLIRLG
ncbi:glycosyltransferase family 2 protein [Vibrio cholerae]|uniref:glycosyltransferase family 2 protein n=1 Tax=Vibrio cholerae TaxID=666 RepID=UPI001CA3688A